MNMLKKTLIIIGIATIMAIIGGASVFAAIEECLEKNYPNLSFETDDTFRVKCTTVEIDDKYVTIYAKSAADCASAHTFVSNPDACDDQEIEEKFSICVGEDKKYPNLSLKRDETYIIKCPQVRYNDNKYVSFYAKTSADCASVSIIASDPDSCTYDEGTIYNPTTIEIDDGPDHCKGCIGPGRKYPNLSLSEDEEHPIACLEVKYKDGTTNSIFGKTTSDCASAEVLAKDPDGCRPKPYYHCTTQKIIIAILIGVGIIICIVVGYFIIRSSKNKKQTPPTTPQAPSYPTDHSQPTEQNYTQTPQDDPTQNQS